MLFDFYGEGYTAGESAQVDRRGSQGSILLASREPDSHLLKNGGRKGSAGGRRLKIKQAQVEFCSARMTSGGSGGGGGERVETEMSRDKSRGSAALSKRG